MTPDDQRPRTPAAGSAEDPTSSAQSGEQAAGDDLESLAGALPSPGASEAPPADADEEHDLGALAAVGGKRASANSGSRPPHPTAASSGPAAPSARPAWLLPLVLGLGIGAGTAAAVFFATSTAPESANASAPAAAAREAATSAAPKPSVTAALPPAPVDRVPPANAVAAAAGSASVAAPPHAAAPSRAPAATPVARKEAVAHDGEAAQPAADAPAPGSADFVLPGDPLADDDTQTETAEKAAAPAASDPAAKVAPSVDALLDEALSPTARRDELARRQQQALADQQLPLTPSREDVTQAMTVLLPAIRGCAMGQSGLATAAIVVRADGRVAGVEVTGAPFAGTASGRCMEGVIRRARFTPFRQPILRIKFPLAIQ